MRAFFFLLLFANLVFFAYHQGYLGSLERAGESYPLAQQISPEKIRLLTRDQVQSMSAAASTAAAALCVEWGGFAPAEVSAAEQSVQAFANKVIQRRSVEATTGYWVYIAPTADRPQAERKLVELKRQGVSDSYLVQDQSGFNNAISLGVFRTEDAARTQLDQLRVRGVKSLQLGEHSIASPRIFLQIRDNSISISARLKELSSKFPGSTVRDCLASSG